MIAIPTLTIDGFESSPINQMNKLFEYYQVAEYSQSNTFKGEVVSLKKTLLHSSSPEMLKNEIEKDLYNLYSSCFDTVTPEIKIESDEDKSFLNVYLNVTCTKGETKYTLSRDFKSKDGILVDVNSTLNKIYMKHMS